LPYLAELATDGVRAVVATDPGLRRGVNTAAGSVTNEAVARALDSPAVPVADALGTR
jgi:alanine dehydrogenase